MFGFGEARQKHEEVYGQRRGNLGHEALAGGVAFEAMKRFEDHQRSKGERVSHGFAKDLIMGIAGAEMEKRFETRGGLRHADREEAKHRARQQAENLYDQQYGDDHDYNPHQSRRHNSMDYY